MESPSDRATEVVGIRLRAARIALGMTLREASTAARISESFLSQLERGKASASIASLARLTAVLGLSMAELFGPRSDARLRPLRRHERSGVPFGQSGVKCVLTPAHAVHMETFTLELQPQSSTGAVQLGDDQTEAIVLVVEGAVVISVGGETHELGPGDSLTFMHRGPCEIVNPAAAPADVLWLVTTRKPAADSL